MDAETQLRMVRANCCPSCGGKLSVRVPRKVKVCGQRSACGRWYDAITGASVAPSQEKEP